MTAKSKNKKILQSKGISLLDPTPQANVIEVKKQVEETSSTGRATRSKAADSHNNDVIEISPTSEKDPKKVSKKRTKQSESLQDDEDPKPAAVNDTLKETSVSKINANKTTKKQSKLQEKLPVDASESNDPIEVRSTDNNILDTESNNVSLDKKEEKKQGHTKKGRPPSKKQKNVDDSAEKSAVDNTDSKKLAGIDSKKLADDIIEEKRPKIKRGRPASKKQESVIEFCNGILEDVPLNDIVIETEKSSPKKKRKVVENADTEATNAKTKPAKATTQKSNKELSSDSLQVPEVDTKASEPAKADAKKAKKGKKVEAMSNTETSKSQTIKATPKKTGKAASKDNDAKAELEAPTKDNKTPTKNGKRGAERDSEHQGGSGKSVTVKSTPKKAKKDTPVKKGNSTQEAKTPSKNLTQESPKKSQKAKKNLKDNVDVVENQDEEEGTKKTSKKKKKDVTDTSEVSSTASDIAYEKCPSEDTDSIASSKDSFQQVPVENLVSKSDLELFENAKETSKEILVSLFQISISLTLTCLIPV